VFMAALDPEFLNYRCGAAPCPGSSKGGGAGP
jgi:hypothetical protein